MTGSPAADEPRRGAIELLHDPVFGPFIIGKMLSNSGIWIQGVASAVLVYTLTRSTFMVGVVSAVQFGGPVMLALWMGALSDRVDRRRMLIVGRLFSACSMTTLSLLIAIRGVDGFGGLPVLFTAVGVLSIGIAVSNPAMQAIVPGLVPRRDLEPALALGAATPSIARTVGPAVGAGLLAVGGPALAFGAAALCDWGFSLALVFVRVERHAPSARQRLLDGVRYLFADRNAGFLVLGVAAVGFGADPAITLVPELADQFGGDATMVGAFVSSFGGGSVLLVIGLRAVRRRMGLRTSSIVGFWCFALGLWTVAGSWTPVVAGLGFFVGGIGFMLSTVGLTTRIQRRVPEELRGRVMALWGVAFLGSRPVAALVNGGIAELVSLRAALALAGCVVAVSSLFARVRYETTPAADRTADELPSGGERVVARPSGEPDGNAWRSSPGIPFPHSRPNSRPHKGSHMSVAEINGVNVHYEVEGKGPAVVLVHGRGGNHMAWFQQVPDLAADHTVVTFDLRGFGGSQLADGQDHSMEHHPHDVAALIDHLGLDAVYVVGQAMGGYAALQLACLYPHKVRGLMLSSSLGGVADRQIIDSVQERRREYSKIPYPYRNFRPWFVELRPELAYMWRLQRDSAPPYPADYLDPLWAGGGPGVEDLAALRIPTIIMAGEYDCVMPIGAAERMGELIPGARVVIVEDSGHCTYYERPAFYGQMIRELVRS